MTNLRVVSAILLIACLTAFTNAADVSPEILSITDYKTQILSTIDAGDYQVADSQIDTFVSEYTVQNEFPKDAYEISYKLWKKEQHDIQTKVCNEISKKAVGTEWDLLAKRDLIRVAIKQNSSADIALENFKQTFKGQGRYSQALYYIASQYRSAGRHDKAKSLYQEVEQNYKSDIAAYWSSRDLIYSCIESGDLTLGEVAFDNFTKNHSAKMDASKDAIMAVSYCWKHGHRKFSRQFCERIVATWPGSEAALLAEGDVVRLDIKAGKGSDAENIYNSLCTKYSSQKRLPEALYYIAKEYKLKGDTESSIMLHKNIANNWSDNLFACESYKRLLQYSLTKNQVTEAKKYLEKIAMNFCNKTDLGGYFNGLVLDCWTYGDQLFSDAIYDDVLVKYPETDAAFLTEINKLRLSIKNGSKFNLNDKISDFEKRYNKSDKFSQAYYYLAKEFGKKNETRTRNYLLDYISAKWPESKQSIYASKELILHDLRFNRGF